MAPSGVVVSSTGEIFVSDRQHFRVLVYPPDSRTPHRVIGQSNFTNAVSFRGAGKLNSLRFPDGLTLDAEGGLYVCDAGNHCVLYFPHGSKEATRVYGQRGMTVALPSATSLHSPRGVAVTRDGVWIADSSNNRVLFYPDTKTTATLVLGQPSLTSNEPGTAVDRLHFPLAVRPDANGGVYVVDSWNNRVLYFPAGASEATRVYGQPNGPYGVPSASTLRLPADCALDPQGGLYVADANNNRVLYYPPGVTTATRVWGQGGDFSCGEQNMGGAGAGLSRPTAVALGPDGRLYIADLGNNRVLGFA